MKGTGMDGHPSNAFQQVVHEPASEWSCPRCTLHNSGGVPNCQACGFTRGQDLAGIGTPPLAAGSPQLSSLAEAGPPLPHRPARPAASSAGSIEIFSSGSERALKYKDGIRNSPALPRNLGPHRAAAEQPAPPPSTFVPAQDTYTPPARRAQQPAPGFRPAAPKWAGAEWSNPDIRPAERGIPGVQNVHYGTPHRKVPGLESTEQEALDQRIIDQNAVRAMRAPTQNVTKRRDMGKPPEFNIQKMDRYTKAKFSPLSTLQRRTVKDNLREPDRERVVMDSFNLKVTVEHLSTLEKGNWLNDQVINFYLCMLTERNHKNFEDDKYPRQYKTRTMFLNSFFYAKMTDESSGGYNYDGVKGWTKPGKLQRIEGVDNIFELDQIIFPVHTRTTAHSAKNHWCLAAINFAEKRVEYYDSMTGQHPSYFFRHIMRYLQDEAEDKGIIAFRAGEWRQYTPDYMPLQNNESDCGVFCCKYAEFISERRPIIFQPKHMTYFRERIMLEIIMGGLLPETR